MKDTPYSNAYKRKISPKTEKKKIISEIKKEVKAEVKQVKTFVKKQEVNLEKKFGKKKVLKTERIIILSIYVIIALIAGYFFLVNVNPDIMPDDFYSYQISASSTMITSPLRSLYLKENDVLGKNTQIGNRSGRLIVEEKPFKFIFNPKRKIEENTTAKIQLAFSHPGTEIYLNEKLIIPDLSNFKKIANFNDEEIWVRNTLAQPNYIQENSTNEFIYSNFPGKDFYSFGEISGGTPIISDYEQTETMIPTRFRENLKLAVYAEGDLKINFVKQDLNWYLGKDQYTVEITDLQGNSFYKNTYLDDGIKRATNEEGKEQERTIEGKDLPRNIYFITFTKDENNKASDSTIKDIRINSNKVLIIGKTLPLNQFKFYTKVNIPQKIGFYYWWGDKTQKIEVSGDESKIIDLDESWKGKKYEQELSPGKYNFEIKKGYLWVYSNRISPSKATWFNLPSNGDGKMVNQDIITINKNTINITNNEVRYTGAIDVEKDTQINLQVLDKLEIYFKEIKLVL